MSHRDSLQPLPPRISPDRVDALRDLFPEAFVDGALDAEVLVALCGHAAVRSGFGFTWARRGEAEAQANLPPTQTIRAVTTEPAPTNVVIGDNLEAMRCMLGGYRGSVRLVYMDPPYNRNDDLVYQDTFSESIKSYLEGAGELDEHGIKLATYSQTDGRYHSNWLSMMYPRLMLAKQLLHREGVIAVSIGDDEVHHLRALMNLVFGEDCALPTLVWNKNHSQQQGDVAKYHEYVLLYMRSKQHFTGFAATGSPKQAIALKAPGPKNAMQEFTFPAGMRCEAPDGTEFLEAWGARERVELVRGRFRVQHGMTQDEMTLRAAWTQAGQMRQMLTEQQTEVFDTRGQRILEFYFTSTGKLKIRKERTRETIKSVLDYGKQSAATEDLTALFYGKKVFDYPKPVAMLSDLIRWVCGDDPNALILDLFAGSGTTAEAVWSLNASQETRLRLVLVQAEETIPSTAPAFALGYRSIPQVLLDRLVLSAKRVRIAGGSDVDTSFRLLRVTPSSLRPVVLESGSVADRIRAALRDVSEVDPEQLAWEVAQREKRTLDARVTSDENGLWRVREESRSTIYLAVDELACDWQRIQELVPEGARLYVVDELTTDEALANLSATHQAALL